jgi:hypothetical protein
LEEGSWKWEVGSGKLEVGSWKREVGSGELEVGSGEWGVGSEGRRLPKVYPKLIKTSCKTLGDFSLALRSDDLNLISSY